MVGYSRARPRSSFLRATQLSSGLAPSSFLPNNSNSATPQVQVWLQQQFSQHPPLVGQSGQDWLRWRLNVANGMTELAALQAVHGNQGFNTSAPPPPQQPVSIRAPAPTLVQAPPQASSSYIAPGLYSKCHRPTRSVQSGRRHPMIEGVGKYEHGITFLKSTTRAQPQACQAQKRMLLRRELRRRLSGSVI